MIIMMNKLPVAVAFQITVEKLQSGEIKNLVEKVGKTRASYVEFRLDYENDVQSVPLKDLVSLARDNELKSILTCRIKSEGGFFDHTFGLSDLINNERTQRTFANLMLRVILRKKRG